MPRGGKRPGAGAKKGAPRISATQLRLDLVETLRENGFDPAAKLIEVHTEAMRRYRQRWSNSRNGFGAQGYLQIAHESAKDLMEFIYPKRKAVELTGAQGRDLFQSFTDLVRDIAQSPQPLPPKDVPSQVEDKAPESSE